MVTTLCATQIIPSIYLANVVGRWNACWLATWQELALDVAVLPIKVIIHKEAKKHGFKFKASYGGMTHACTKLHQKRKSLTDYTEQQQNLEKTNPTIW